jgi:hypothetical protein
MLLTSGQCIVGQDRGSGVERAPGGTVRLIMILVSFSAPTIQVRASVGLHNTTDLATTDPFTYFVF